MRLLLVCIGRLKAGPERDLVARYVDRAAAGSRQIGIAGLEVRELPESRAATPDERRSLEARALEAAIGGIKTVVFDERGAPRDSAAFAALLAGFRDGGQSVALVVGGPDGLDASLRERAAAVLSFGAMTWPHQLVRIMAAEQIYRATTILAGHPYHRA